ncbi:MAG: hypothetical protein HYU73_29415 [Betaproteobacteria bacterium]|nr:hypothetical protein [Betaproteobacteria bacterium]MBI3055589.1 hypothetical protein [Betaproteobacteria bacterium]
MSEDKRDIDWSLTTWEGSRRAQLRHALKLTLRERLEAVEGLADVMRRFEEMRAKGEFTSATGGTAQTQAAPSVHEPPSSYEDRDK